MKHCYREAITKWGGFTCHCTTFRGKVECVIQMRDQRPDCTFMGFNLIKESELNAICRLAKLNWSMGEIHFPRRKS